VRPDYLRKLKRRHAPNGPSSPDALGELFVKYRDYRRTNVIDMAAVATSITAADLLGPQPDPLALKAISDTSPSFDPHAYYSDEQIAGFVNAAKGKYFEYLVAERLNDGEPVGDLVLPSGFRAEVAASMNQPGWDLKILGPQGQVDEYLQLKATDSTSYIRDALEKYPDIKILATDEAASQLGSSHMVIDSSISEDEIRAVVQEGVGDDGGLLDSFWDSFHPVLPLLLIAGMQGYQIAVGRRTVGAAVEVGLARAHRALIAAGTGAMVKALGGGWLAIPAAVIAGYWITNSQKIDELVERLRKGQRKLSLQSVSYGRLMGR